MFSFPHWLSIYYLWNIKFPLLQAELWKKPSKLVGEDKEQLSVSQLQGKRLKGPSHDLHGDLLQQAILSNSFPSNGNSCLCFIIKHTL